MRKTWNVVGIAGIAAIAVGLVAAGNGLRAAGGGASADGSGALATADPVPGDVAAQEMGCNFTAPPEELAERTSPADSSSLRIEAGMLKICYSSPSARDREIMGGLVPYGQPWRLGANEPTYLQLDFPARIGDVAVEPGGYVLYAIPGEDEWTLAVNGAVERWGIPIDESVTGADVGRTTVAAGSTDEHVESLSLELEAADGGARLVMQWERTRIVVPIRPGD